MGLIIFIIIIVFFCFVRRVPPNTAIIIDRDSHYLKTKRRGFYFINPATDKITTRVSTFPITEFYSNTFETHDSTFYHLYFQVTYKATDIEMVLSSLQDSRRSIYDVVNCSLETVIGTLSRNDMNYKVDINSIAFRQLESMLEPFYIDVTSFKLISRNEIIAELGRQQKFQKHVSSGENPISN